MNHIPKVRPRVLSLFSGAGGLDIGFHEAGFDIVESVEVDAVAAETLRSNSITTSVKCVDVRDYTPDVGGINFVIGGPPCQSFSAVGRRSDGIGGVQDPRGSLFEHYVRIVNRVQPAGFLFENVPGMLGSNCGDDWATVKQALENIGVDRPYDIHVRVMDAADYGVSQFRKRLFIIGCRRGDRDYRFPAPTHGYRSSDWTPYVSAQQAVAGADVSDAPVALDGKYGHLLENIPPGLNYSFYTAKMGHPKPVFKWRSKFFDFLGKADPLEPVRTIKASPGKFTGPFSWENRPFSTGELKRLQTIPDDYVLAGNRKDRVRQIGNSVPPLLARALGLSLHTFLLGTPPQTPLLETNKRYKDLRSKQASFDWRLSIASKAIAEQISDGRIKLS